MVVGIVIEKFDPCRGGAEVYTADFARWLLDTGRQVVVIAAEWAAESLRLEPDPARTAAPAREDAIRPKRSACRRGLSGLESRQ